MFIAWHVLLNDFSTSSVVTHTEGTPEKGSISRFSSAVWEVTCRLAALRQVAGESRT